MINLAASPDFRIGAVEVRPRAREVVGPGGREALEPRVMQVLVALADARGAVVTREELTECCWDGRVVGEDAVQRVMVRIRRLSETVAAGSFKLETVVKVGYRLVDLQPATDAASANESAPAAPTRRIGGRQLSAIAAVLLLVVFGGYAAIRQAESRADAARRAEAARAADLRNLASYSLFELNGQLARVAGNTSARVGLAERAHRSLATLAAAPGADDATKLETARSLISLARAQGVPARPNLGERERARSNLKTAIALLRPLAAADAAAHVEMADALTALALIQLYNDADRDAAATSLRQAEAALARVPAPRRSDRWHSARGVVRHGHIEAAVMNQAVPELRQQTDLLEADIAARPPALRSSRETALDRAYVAYYRGQHDLFTDALDAAIPMFERAEALFRAVERELPNDPIALYGLMWNSYVGYGTASGLPNREREAAHFLDLAMATSDRLLSLEANDAALKSFAGNLRLVQSQALSAAGNHQAALAMQRTVIDLYQGALASDVRPITLNRLATALITMGNIARAADDRGLACRSYQTARDHIRELERKDRLLGTVKTFLPRLDGNIARCADGAPLSAMVVLS